MNKNRASELTVKSFVYYISTEILQMIVILNHSQLRTRYRFLSVSMHACGSVPIVMVLHLAELPGPPEFRYVARFRILSLTHGFASYVMIFYLTMGTHYPMIY